MKTYKAPWGRALVLSTVLASLFCAGLTFAIPYLPQHDTASVVVRYVRWLPAALVPFCSLFMVMGYVVTDDEVRVKRLLWSNRIPRKSLTSARAEPGALSRSVRICGNGGFFSFSGFFRSEKLGSFRAYVTDLNRTVVLRTEKRTYVLSPDEPERFVRDLEISS